MTTISCPLRIPPPVSPRTAKYVVAMVCEDFDYDKWLKKVREEEAEAKLAEAIGTPGELGPAALSKPISTPNDRGTRPNPALRLMTTIIRLPRALRQSSRQATSQTPKARLGRWLEKVRLSWDEFQSSRARDAVYEYLAAVFAVVMHYKVRRTNRLLRHAFAFADLQFDKHSDPFSAVIRCTCGDGADNKTISKYARALRYTARRKEPDIRLKTFVKGAGGINSCAARYAKYYGRSVRQISQG